MDGEIDTSLECLFLSYYLESIFQFLLEISLEINFASGSTLQVFNLQNGSVWLILGCMILCLETVETKKFPLQPQMCVGLAWKIQETDWEVFSNMIEKDWLELGKESFKLKAEIHLIQKGLELWKYMS